VLAIFPVASTKDVNGAGDEDGAGGITEAGACEAALRAIGAARAGMARLDAEREKQGLASLPFGAALHLGEILWGNIGAADRLDFTAIGPAVNLVSRLEGLCRPLGRSVLISGSFAAEIATPLLALGKQDLRGIAEPCAVFTIPEA
jgi:adenylate cyclase